MFCSTALSLAALAACYALPATGAAASDPNAPGPAQESVTQAPSRTEERRVDVTFGFTAMHLRKLPADAEVGGLPAGVVVGAAFAWTPRLRTEFEFASQIEKWNPDYAFEYLVVETPANARNSGGLELATVQLKHDYRTNRWTLAQTVEFGTSRFRPYVGGGAGVETQTVRDVRVESSRPISGLEDAPPFATTVDELPTEFPDPQPTHHAIAFVATGFKVFMPRRVYVLVDLKWTSAGHALVNLGVGFELF